MEMQAEIVGFKDLVPVIQLVDTNYSDYVNVGHQMVTSELATFAETEIEEADHKWTNATYELWMLYAHTQFTNQFPC